MTKNEDRHSLSIPDTLFGEEIHHPLYFFFFFESRLKPEKNKDKKREEPNIEAKSMGSRELEGLLQVTQAWQLVLGLWTVPSHKGNITPEASRARTGLVRLRGWATSVNSPPALQLHTEPVHAGFF